MSPIAWMLPGLMLPMCAYWAVAAWRERQRRRQVERESMDRTQFLADLGHEVRTPITGVMGMSELLLDGPLDPSQRRKAEAIRQAGDHLLRLLDDALDIARIEAGRLLLDPQPFEVRVLVAEVCALHAPLARRRGLAFVESVAAGVPSRVHGDPLRIRQVLFNLLGNAMKFTQDGEVGLRVYTRATSPGMLFMAVHDTGPGLRRAQRARMFGRYEQGGDAGTARRHRGSGLGLAISQELAAAMGGRIHVESAPGRGTRFIVALPLPPA